MYDRRSRELRAGGASKSVSKSVLNIKARAAQRQEENPEMQSE